MTAALHVISRQPFHILLRQPQVAFARYHRHSSGNDNGSLIPGMARRGHRSPLTFITLIKHFKKIKTFQKKLTKSPYEAPFSGWNIRSDGVFFFFF